MCNDEPITVAREIWFSGWLGLGHMLCLCRRVVPLPPGHLDFEWRWRDLSKMILGTVRKRMGKGCWGERYKNNKDSSKMTALFPSTIFSQFMGCTAFIIVDCGGELDRPGQYWNFKTISCYLVQSVPTAFSSVCVVL